MNGNNDISHWNQNDFRQFVESYGAAFLAFATRYTGDRSSAEDIVQDCLCQLWIEQKKNREVKIANAPAYVLTMIKNRALNHLRKQKRISSQELRPEMRFEENFMEDMAIRQNSQIIAQALDALPGHWRTVMCMSMAGSSNKEIAEAMALTVDGVKSIKTRAILRLREIVPAEIKPGPDWP